MSRGLTSYNGRTSELERQEVIFKKWHSEGVISDGCRYGEDRLSSWMWAEERLTGLERSRSERPGHVTFVDVKCH